MTHSDTGRRRVGRRPTGVAVGDHPLHGQGETKVVTDTLADGAELPAEFAATTRYEYVLAAARPVSVKLVWLVAVSAVQVVPSGERCT